MTAPDAHETDPPTPAAQTAEGPWPHPTGDSPPIGDPAGVSQPNPTRELESGVRRWGLWAALALMALHGASYTGFISDDAFISLRYARHMLDGLGLVWNPGEWVEGYSNPAWVLLVASLGSLGMDLVWATRVLGFGSALLSILLVWRWAGGGRAGTAGVLLLAAAPPLAVWCVGGLEANLVALCLTGALTTTLPRPCMDPIERHAGSRAWLAGMWLALLIWTRPDGALLAGLVGLGQWLAHSGQSQPVEPDRRTPLSGRRLMQRTAILPAIAFAALLILRFTLYGEWVPNTAHIKADLDMDLFRRGWERYLVPSLIWLGGCAALLLAALLVPGRRRASAILLVAIGWCAYVTAIGGDIFPGRRHMVPLVVCGALAAVHLLNHTPGGDWRGRLLRTVAPALAILAAASLLLGTFLDEANQRARTERWEAEGLALGRTLGFAFADARGSEGAQGSEGARGSEGALLACSAAGALPYAAGLRTIDTLGLNDKHIARQPRRRGNPPAHDRTDMDYVLGQGPDLIAFGPPPGMLNSGFPPWADVMARPSFFAEHRILPVFGQLPGEQLPVFHYGVLWIRAEGPLGVQRNGDTSRIPGYLFTTVAGQTVMEDGRGIWGDAIYRALMERSGRAERDAGLAATADSGPLGLFIKGGRYPLEHDLPAGNYRVTIATQALLGQPGDSVRIVCGDNAAATGGQLTVDPGIPLALEVPANAAVQSVTMERIP